MSALATRLRSCHERTNEPGGILVEADNYAVVIGPKCLGIELARNRNGREDASAEHESLGAREVLGAFAGCAVDADYFAAVVDTSGDRLNRAREVDRGVGRPVQEEPVGGIACVGVIADYFAVIVDSMGEGLGCLGVVEGGIAALQESTRIDDRRGYEYAVHLLRRGLRCGMSEDQRPSH